MRKLMAKHKRTTGRKPLLQPRVGTRYRFTTPAYSSAPLPQHHKSDDVVIVCISGFRGGNDNGMSHLVATLRKRLKAAYGVQPNNIFHMQWNREFDSNPTKTPDLMSILDEVSQRTASPNYLAFIGHSFGGWAACRLSRVTKKAPNFIGLIDPVFGPANMMTPRDLPRAAQITNWYQNNGVTGMQCPSRTLIPCSSPAEGIPCGLPFIPGVNQTFQVEYLKKFDNKTFETCPGTGDKLRAYHTNIDDDQGVHRQIFDQINSDLKKLLKSNTAQRRKHIRSAR